MTSDELTRLPKVSWTSTWSGMALPAAVSPGCVKNASRAAAPDKIANGLLTAGARAPDVARKLYPEAALLRLRSEKLARPLTAATERVPDSVEPPGFVSS